MKTIVLTRNAARDLDAIPAQPRHSIAEALAAYAVEGSGDVKKLSGRDGYRLRVGDHRVIFDDDGATILAVYIGRRTTTTYSRN
jgi:mRNA interferase RelE/StbE